MLDLVGGVVLHVNLARSMACPRHTYCTRLLYTVVPSENYAPKSATQQKLMEYLVNDANKLYTEGIQARHCGQVNLSACNVPCTTHVNILQIPQILQKLYHPLQVTWQGRTTRWFFKYLGTKGDWPWLRSCFKLSAGFTSKRKCHKCASTEPCLQLQFQYQAVHHALA